MRKDPRCLAVVCVLFIALSTIYGPAQEPIPTAKMPSNSESLSFAVGAKISSLGGGVEVGTSLTERLNLRVGGNFFNYTTDSTRDSVNYQGRVRLHTLEGHLDFFPFHGSFHISPGVLWYYSTPLSASLAAPGGNKFSLGNTDFISDPADPVTGSASFHNHRVAPSVTVGFGNLLPRAAGAHWSFPFEIGAAFHGDPTINIGLRGTACVPGGGPCYIAATDPNVLGPLKQEIQRRQNDISWFKFYPIISMGVGYRF